MCTDHCLLLLAEEEKIGAPYFNGNLNAAFQDLINKTLQEQDFVPSHITHVRDCVENQCMHVRDCVENQCMGKTVPSFRMALEFEIDMQKGLRKALVAKNDQEVFEELMDMCRNNAIAAIILLALINAVPPDKEN